MYFHVILTGDLLFLSAQGPLAADATSSEDMRRQAHAMIVALSSFVALASEVVTDGNGKLQKALDAATAGKGADGAVALVASLRASFGAVVNAAAPALDDGVDVDAPPAS